MDEYGGPRAHQRRIKALEDEVERLQGTLAREDADCREHLLQSEAAGNNTAERYRSLIEHLSDWVWEVDAQLRYTYSSPRIRDLLGYTPEDVIGKRPYDFMPPHEALRVDAIFAPLLRRHEPFSLLEHTLLHKDGHAVVVETSGIPLFDDQRQFRGYRGSDRDVTARKATEQKLLESEARYRLLVEGSREIFFYIHDRAYRLQYLSPSVQEVLGYSPDELHGVPFTTLLTGDPADEHVLQLTDAALTEGKRLPPYETVVRARDGRLLTLEVVETPIVTDGVVVGLQGFARDITEHQRAQTALRESEERLAEAQHLAHLGSFLVDLPTSRVEWSAETMHIFGLDPAAPAPGIEEFMGYLHPDDHARVWDAIQDAVRTASSFRFTFRIVRTDGDIRYVQCQGAPRAEQGTVVALFGTLQDITDLHRIEEALHSNIRFLETLLNTLPDPLYYKDVDGRYLGANPAFARAMGISPAEIIGKTIHDLVPHALADDYQAADQELFANPGTRHFESSIRYADGSPHDTIFSLATFMRADGTLGGLLGVITDITPIKAAQEDARRNEAQLRSVLVAAPIGIAVLRGGAFQMLNDSLLTMLGYTRDELLGQRPRLLFADEDAYARVDPFLELRPSADLLSHSDTQLRKKDGTFVDVIVTATPIAPTGAEQDVVVAVQDISERKRMERALRENEGRLRQALNAANEGLWDWQIAAGTVYYSPRYYAMLGYQPGDFPMTFASWSDLLLHPEDRERVLTYINQQVRERIPSFEIEFRMCTKGGAWRWMLARGQIIEWDSAGNAVRMVGTHVDITDLKRTEAELRATNRALRMLTESNQSLLRATDEGELLQSVCNIIVGFGGYRMAWIGFVADDPDGKIICPMACMGGDDAFLPQREFTWDTDALGTGPTGSAIRTGLPQVIDDIAQDPLTSPWRDEALRRGYCSAVAIPLLDGPSPLGVLTIFADTHHPFSKEELRLLNELAGDVAFGISAMRTRNERQHAEEREVQQRAFLSTIIDILPFPIAIFATDRSPILANHASFSFSTLPQARWWDVEFLTPDTHIPIPQSEWPLERSLHGEVITAMEGIFRFEDGREIPVLVQSAPVYVDDTLVAAVIAFQDVSDLKAANRAKDEFLAVLSHELKTPLTSIIGWTHIAFDNAEAARKALEVIDRNAQRQRRVLEDLIDVSKLIYNKLYIKLETIDLWQIATQCAEDIERTAQEKELTIQLEAPDVPLLVCGDVSRLRQVIGNLLDNAMKFTPPGGTITVHGWREGELIMLSIRDTGRGIAPEHLTKLFHPFLQIQRDERKGGLGLGLALVRGIVELHHGAVYATSPGVGQGSTVTIELPVLDDHACPPNTDD